MNGNPKMPIKATSYAHQQEGFDYLCSLFAPDGGDAISTGAALLMEMGTGKTLTSIAITGALYQSDKIRRALVVAPLSILGVWSEEFEKFADFNYNLTVLSGTGAKKADTLRQMSGDGEFMLSILASYAQEESRNVSENCKWRVRKMFAEGRPNGDNMLGYRLVDGTYQIVPEEAETVKLIFELILSGMGREAVCKRLNSMGLKTRRGYEWREGSLTTLLRNDKYTGNMLLQKTYRSDHLSKKRMVNRGELPQYRITDSHEAIIDQDTFDRVQDALDGKMPRPV